MSLPIRGLPSPNHDDRPADEPIDMLILHYTGMRSAEEAIKRLRDPVARVSSHYVVDEDGAVFGLVPEERRAFHAGISHWRGSRHAMSSHTASCTGPDRGEKFDWRSLAQNGVGLWPEATASSSWPGLARQSMSSILDDLAASGYRTHLPLAVWLRAFQRYWRQAGAADEGTLARINAVRQLVADTR